MVNHLPVLLCVALCRWTIVLGVASSSVLEKTSRENILALLRQENEMIICVRRNILVKKRKMSENFVRMYVRRKSLAGEVKIV